MISKPLTTRELWAMDGTRELEIDRVCGIYFLVRDGVVVYVGKSVHVRGRVDTHLSGNGYGSDKGRIDRVFVFEAPEDDVFQLEGALIRLYQPALNGYTKNGKRLLHANGCPSGDLAVLTKYKWPMPDDDLSIAMGG